MLPTFFPSQVLFFRLKPCPSPRSEILEPAHLLLQDLSSFTEVNQLECLRNPPTGFRLLCCSLHHSSSTTSCRRDATSPPSRGLPPLHLQVPFLPCFSLHFLHTFFLLVLLYMDRTGGSWLPGLPRFSPARQLSGLFTFREKSSN